MKMIEEIIATSKKERWPYPKTLTNLEKLGVIRYDVTFDGIFNAVYSTHQGAFTEETPIGYIPTEVNPKFSKENIQKAIKEHIEKKTPYTSILVELNQAGVSGYTVCVQSRTVTYHNRDKTQTQEEHVPEWTE